MGACISLSHRVIDDDGDLLHHSPFPTAAVISISGDLHHYALPITAGQVLESEPHQSFICNSDAFTYEEFIPTLNPSHELLPDSLYFILPNPKLHCRLTGTDMAALAIMASLALRKEEAMQTRRRNNNKCAKVSPVRVFRNNNNNGYLRSDSVVTIASVDMTSPYARSGSVPKFKKMQSKRVNGNRVVRLNTIYEGHEEP